LIQKIKTVTLVASQLILIFLIRLNVFLFLVQCYLLKVNNLNALNTTTGVEPSWISTAIPILANPKMVEGISNATIPKLIHRFCLIIPLAFLLKPIAKGKVSNLSARKVQPLHKKIQSQYLIMLRR